MERLFVFGCLIAVLAAGISFGAFLVRGYAANTFDGAVLASLEATRLAARRGEVQQPLRQRDASLVFVGDIMLARGVGVQIKKNNDPRFPFLRMERFLREADFSFGNLESPVSVRGENRGSIYSFRADPRAAPGLSFAGFDVVSLANNHIFDWGREGLEDTLSYLRQAGVAAVGAGLNETEANAARFFDVGGTRFALLAYTTLYPDGLKARGNVPGVSDFTLERAREAIRAARDAAQVVIVSMHWGLEYQKSAGDEQRAIGHALIDAGADLVIGHHPHVVQEVERYKQGLVAYSLGNFVFDQDFSEETARGLLLRVLLRDGNVFAVEKYPVQINSVFQPELLPEVR